MRPSSRTPEGEFSRCPVCNAEVRIEPSHPSGDVSCPRCGQLLWFPAVSGVEGLNFFAGQGIVHELDVATKREVLEVLVRRLSELGHVPAEVVPLIVVALMRREQLGSTGIGRGIAVPHATHDAIKQLVGIMAEIPGGVAFDSLDGEPVNRVYLLLAPATRPEVLWRALERISRTLRAAL